MTLVRPKPTVMAVVKGSVAATARTVPAIGAELRTGGGSAGRGALAGSTVSAGGGVSAAAAEAAADISGGSAVSAVPDSSEFGFTGIATIGERPRRGAVGTV
jgi:hypothetical protein